MRALLLLLAALPAFGGGVSAPAPMPAVGSFDIVRLVLDGPPRPDAAVPILSDALSRWPQGLSARFLVLPGAFIETPLPETWAGRQGWQSRPEDVRPLVAHAEKALARVLNPEVLRAAFGKVDYITAGVDVLSKEGLRGPHAELVAVYDVKKGRPVAWTGKSFPTSAQENRLVQVSDLRTHFLRLGRERVVILGCNDLNLLSPRVAANVHPDSPRGRMQAKMVEMTRRFNPTLIIQHPHATDTPNMWRMTWTTLSRRLPKIRAWASAIRYFNPLGSPRKPLSDVLRLTKSGADRVLDLVVPTKAYSSRSSRYFDGLKRF